MVGFIKKVQRVIKGQCSVTHKTEYLFIIFKIATLPGFRVVDILVT